MKINRDLLTNAALTLLVGLACASLWAVFRVMTTGDLSAVKAFNLCHSECVADNKTLPDVFDKCKAICYPTLDGNKVDPPCGNDPQ